MNEIVTGKMIVYRCHLEIVCSFFELLRNHSATLDQFKYRQPHASEILLGQIIAVVDVHEAFLVFRDRMLDVNDAFGQSCTPKYANSQYNDYFNHSHSGGIGSQVGILDKPTDDSAILVKSVGISPQGIGLG